MKNILVFNGLFLGMFLSACASRETSRDRELAASNPGSRLQLILKLSDSAVVNFGESSAIMQAKNTSNVLCKRYEIESGWHARVKGVRLKLSTQEGSTTAFDFVSSQKAGLCDYQIKELSSEWSDAKLEQMIPGKKVYYPTSAEISIIQHNAPAVEPRMSKEEIVLERGNRQISIEKKCVPATFTSDSAQFVCNTKVVRDLTSNRILWEGGEFSPFFRLSDGESSVSFILDMSSSQ